MDSYQVGAMLRNMFNGQLSQLLRRSGRTTEMINNLREGDVVVFLDNRERERVRQLMRDNPVRDKVLLITTQSPHPSSIAEAVKVAQARSLCLRLVLDHGLIEAVYEQSLLDTSTMLQNLSVYVAERGKYADANKTSVYRPES